MTDMGPENGTPEYFEQVERITKVFVSTATNCKEIDEIALLYILDTSYSRSAIAKAMGKAEAILGVVRA